MFNKYVTIFIVGLSIIFLFNATIFLTLSSQGQYKVTSTQLYIDEEDTQSPQDILNIANELWQENTSLVVPETSGRVWAKVAIPEAFSGQSLVLRLKDPLIDDIRIVQAQSKAPRKSKAPKNSAPKNSALQGNTSQNITPQNYKLVNQQSTGDARPFSSRSFALPNVLIPISAEDNVDVVFIGVSTKLASIIDMGIWKQEHFIEFNNKWTIFSGLSFGYILALFCYCLLTYVTSGRSEYWWYGLFMLCCLLHMMSMSGHAYQYFWPNSPSLQNVMGGVSISLLLLSMLKFTLVIHEHASSFFLLIARGLIWVHFACVAASVLSLNSELAKLHILLSIMTLVILPLLLFMPSFKGSKNALLCLLVWLIMMAIGFTSTAAKVGLIDWPLESLYTLLIGFHLEILLIAGALAFDFLAKNKKTISDKNAALADRAKEIAAQDEILSLNKHAQQKLEAQVKAQTQQLENALQDLSLASDELRAMKNQDGLTKLPNRLAFEEASEALAKIAIDSGQPICFIIADIDHFKRINDKYGHRVGDECLRTFSAVLKAKFSLEHYTYCRLGGEEFILATLLPIEQVVEDVNHFREHIENMDVVLDQATISMTVSAGVTQKRLARITDLKSLYANADEKLYLAKQKGRNLVIA